MRLTLGQFILEVDAERTRAYYRQDPGTGCNCSGRRNYVRAAADRFFAASTEDVELLEEGFPTPVLQMELDASLPWLLEKENDYPGVE